MTQELLDFIKKECMPAGGCVPGAVYYDRLRIWRDWWSGRYAPFHVHRECCAGTAPVRRELYKMGMAKKVCEDWATVLVNDRTRLRTSDAGLDRLLLGDRGCMDGFLTAGDFWGRLNAFVEQTFALGTGAAFTETDAQGNLHVRFVSPEWFVPLACEEGEGEIVSCAFIGAAENGGSAEGGACSAVCFLKEDGGWRELRLQRNADGHGYKRKGRFYEKKPFAVFRPAVVNTDPAAAAVGLGASVFACAVDNLKGVDLAYNNFCRDLYLGGKKVFMNQNLTQEDGYGNRVAPDDVAQQLFVTVGDGDLAADAMIVEHNPQLRTEENIRAVQAQLDYLSFKVGLGCRHYRFADDQVVTATQYAGEKQELMQHAMKHAVRLEQFLRELTGIAYRQYLALHPETALPPLGDVFADFDDSFFIDPVAERERDLREVQLGLMLPWEYRVKYYGESEHDAKAALSGHAQ